jgi:NAD(P)-dependent dehydrogenase (short-subunit alcohol dehydrogenase family)
MTRTAVVTGAGTGIGAATVRALAADGWSVVLAGRRREPLEEVAAAVGGLVVPTDVTDEASVRALFDRVVVDHGRLDLLVNNAGSFGPAATSTRSACRSGRTSWRSTSPASSCAAARRSG